MRSPETAVTFVPMEAVGEWGGLDTTASRSLGDVLAGYTFFRDGDVLVAKITPCFENGKGAVATGLLNGFGFGTTELHVMSPSPALDSRFLFYVTISHPFRMLGQGEMFGAGGQKRVPESFLLDYRLGLPALTDQKAIVAFLDRRTAAIDALIAKKERLVELLQEKRQALITQAVTKGLDPNVPMKDSGVEWIGAVPHTWRVQRIATFATKIANGFVGPTRDILVDRGVKYLQSLHIKNNAIVVTPSNEYFVSETWSRTHSRSTLKIGDVVIVQTGDIGQVAHVTEAFAGSNCHALIIVSTVPTVCQGRFLSFVLNSHYGFNCLKAIQTGALHPHLNCGLVKGISIPLPPVDEQDRILCNLASRTERLDSVLRNTTASIERLREYRQALITAAVTGKLDVERAGSQTDDQVEQEAMGV